MLLVPAGFRIIVITVTPITFKNYGIIIDMYIANSCRMMGIRMPESVDGWLHASPSGTPSTV